MNLLPGKNGNAVDSTGSGVVRLRVLAHAGWIDAQVEGTTLKLRLGVLAKKIREARGRGDGLSAYVGTPSFRHEGRERCELPANRGARELESYGPKQWSPE